MTWEDDMVDKRSTLSKFTHLQSYYLDMPIICGRSVNQFMAAIFHLLDVSSDYTYITTVPIYGSPLYWAMISSMALPLIPQLALAATAGDDDVKGEGVLPRIKFFFLGYLGLFDLIAYNLEEETGSDSSNSAQIRSILAVMFALFEDVPQFSLQSLNSVYIG